MTSFLPSGQPVTTHVTAAGQGQGDTGRRNERGRVAGRRDVRFAVTPCPGASEAGRPSRAGPRFGEGRDRPSSALRKPPTRPPALPAPRGTGGSDRTSPLSAAATPPAATVTGEPPLTAVTTPTWLSCPQSRGATRPGEARGELHTHVANGRWGAPGTAETTLSVTCQRDANRTLRPAGWPSPVHGPRTGAGRDAENGDPVRCCWGGKGVQPPRTTVWGGLGRVERSPGRPAAGVHPETRTRIGGHARPHPSPRPAARPPVSPPAHPAPRSALSPGGAAPRSQDGDTRRAGRQQLLVGGTRGQSRSRRGDFPQAGRHGCVSHTLASLGARCPQHPYFYFHTGAATVPVPRLWPAVRLGLQSALDAPSSVGLCPEGPAPCARSARTPRAPRPDAEPRPPPPPSPARVTASPGRARRECRSARGDTRQLRPGSWPLTQQSAAGACRLDAGLKWPSPPLTPRLQPATPHTETPEQRGDGDTATGVPGAQGAGVHGHRPRHARQTPTGRPPAPSPPAAMPLPGATRSSRTPTRTGTEAR